MKIEQWQLNDFVVADRRGNSELTMQNVDADHLVECMDEELQRAIVKAIGEDLAVEVLGLELASD